MQVGTLMAGTDKFYIRVSGAGGHGGTPHLVQDTVVASAAIVMNLQPLISRETDPAQGGIVGVTLINSGTPHLTAFANKYMSMQTELAGPGLVYLDLVQWNTACFLGHLCQCIFAQCKSILLQLV